MPAQAFKLRPESFHLSLHHVAEAPLCGRRHVAPDFNPGCGGSRPMPVPLKGLENKIGAPSPPG